MSNKADIIQHSIQLSKNLLPGIINIIEAAMQKTAIFLNTETSLMYWSIGNYINQDIKNQNRTDYGSRILATLLSQLLTKQYGKGFTYSSLTRMCKVAEILNKEKIATLSQQLSWSHLVEISTVKESLKREFYIQMRVYHRWSVRQMREQKDKMLFERTVISQKPEEVISKQLRELKENSRLNPDLVIKNTYVLDFLNLPQLFNETDLENALVSQIEKFIMELGNGFAFFERQKRILVDGEDYHLDLLFYHRKLKRLIAIDLKLGKFKPAYKGQMELYLRWLEKNEIQEGEEKPIGILLCNEGNTEHIELLMLHEHDNKVAQYLTELPDKKWFADKLHRALEVAKMNTITNKNDIIIEIDD